MRERTFNAARAAAAAVIFLLLSTQPLFALIARRGGAVRVGPNEVIDEDLYLFGEEILVEGRVNGNLFCAGKTVKVLGRVRGSALLAGNRVLVAGYVGDGLKAAARSVVLEGTVGGDLVAMGGEVLLRRGSSVKRDIVAAGRLVSLMGVSDGNARGAGRTIDIGGTVRGSAKLIVRDLSLSSAARIGGDLVYMSEREANIESGAAVGGRVVRRAPEYRERVRRVLPFAFLFGVAGKLLGFLGALLAGLVLVLLFPKWMNGAADALQWEFGPCAGWGALALFLTPVGAAVAAATIIGAPLAALSFLLYLIAVYVSQIVVGFFIGRAIISIDEETAGKGALFGALALGLVIVRLVRLIPVAGYVVLAATAVFGLGAMIVSARTGKHA